jgi:hypothetical protein
VKSPGSRKTWVAIAIAIAAATDLRATGIPAPQALTAGFHCGAIVAAGCNVASAPAAALILRRAERSAGTRVRGTDEFPTGAGSDGVAGRAGRHVVSHVVS